MAATERRKPRDPNYREEIAEVVRQMNRKRGHIGEAVMRFHGPGVVEELPSEYYLAG